jgi:phenol 2-monooxygenase
VSLDEIAAAANKILYPYSVEVRDVGWWSVYEIGQRLCDKFDDVPAEEMDRRLPRVFIAGDACHTHSAKAGQGMNVSMADAFNLGWKLISVLRGIARPELLHTYSEERQQIAKELIEFDEEWSGMLSSPPKPAGQPDAEGVDPDEFRSYFIRNARYTAGIATTYGPSALTAEPRYQHLAEGFPVGMRFHSAPVVRLADAKRMQLGHVARADGAWRIYIFADDRDLGEAGSKARSLCEFLASEVSPLRSVTPSGNAPDSVIDVRAIFQQSHHDLAIMDMPGVLLPRKGRFNLVDYEKVFCPDPKSADIFDLRGVRRESGCVIVVRPDQYVANVLPLEEHSLLADFLERMFVHASGMDAASPVSGVAAAR